MTLSLSQSVTHALTDGTFTFDIQRAAPEICDLSGIWLEWWGNMTWPTFWQFWIFFDNFVIFRQFYTFHIFWQSWQFLTTLTSFANLWEFWKLDNFWKYLTIFASLDNFDHNYNDNPSDLLHLRHWLHFYNWEPEFMTIFVAWQLRVTLDSISNSCDRFCEQFFLPLFCLWQDNQSGGEIHPGHNIWWSRQRGVCRQNSNQVAAQSEKKHRHRQKRTNIS